MSRPILLLSLLWLPVLFWVSMRYTRRKDRGGPRGKGSL